MDVNVTSNAASTIPSGYRMGRPDAETEFEVNGIPEKRDPESEGIRKLEGWAATAEISEAGYAMYRGSVDSTSKQIKDSFDEAAEGFRDFISKIDMGGYSKDITVDDIDMSHIDKMQETYQSWKDKINEIYDGEDKERYLAELDKAYDSAFQEKILNPLKMAFDNKLYTFRPDSEESMSSITAASSSREVLEASVSNYLTIQASKSTHHAALEEGFKGFYDLLNDKSKWHDTEAVKGTINDTMTEYSKHRMWDDNSSVREYMKAYADALSKAISDKYAAEHPLDRLNGQKEGMWMGDKQIDLGAYFKDFLANNTVTTSNGMFVMDFGRIENLSDIIKDVTERFKEAGNKAEEG